MDDFEDIHSSALEENFSSPDFILRDLALAKDCYNDSHNILEARRDLADTISYQICFYCYLILKSFEVTRSNPSILVFGTGFIGTKVVNDLIDNGCGSFLRIYSRGDEGAKTWRSRGIRASNSMKKLYPTEAPDIIVMCSPLSSFTAVSRQLEKIVIKSTFFIFSTLGLRRRRVFMYLKTPGILRTYCEPDMITKKIKSSKFLNSSDVIPVSERRGQQKQEGKPHTSNNIKDDEDSQSSDESGNEDDRVVGDVTSRMSEEELAMSNIQFSAEILARRLIDIRYLIYIIENCYSLRGLPYLTARYETLQAVLGYHDIEYASLAASISVDPVVKHVIEKDGEILMLQEENIDTLLIAIKRLEENVAIAFQQQLSKHIRVMDLPRVSSVIIKLDDLLVHMNYRLLLMQQQQQEGGGGDDDGASLTSNDVLFEKHQLLQQQELLTGAGKNDSFEAMKAKESEILPVHVHAHVHAHSHTHTGDEGSSSQISQAKKWASIFDGAKFSMHQHVHILNIFDQDRNYKALLGKGSGAGGAGSGLDLILEYDGNGDTAGEDEDDKSILSSMDDVLDFAANNPMGSEVRLIDLNKSEGVNNIPLSLISAISGLNKK